MGVCFFLSFFFFRFFFSPVLPPLSSYSIKLRNKKIGTTRGVNLGKASWKINKVIGGKQTLISWLLRKRSQEEEIA
jgi:hypothetical protein